MKRLPVILWYLAFFGLVILSMLPQATRLSRGGIIGLVALIAVTLAYEGRRTVLRFLVPAVVAALAGFFFWPGASRATPAELRTGYVEHLKAFEGCRYYWGGESRWGIDCSGLIRRGLMDAMLSRGLRTLDPALVRQAASLWWNDTSALALMQQHRGLTKLLFEAESINSIDPARLQPGDFAVTADGVHTLAYTGDGTWIQADPFPGKVHSARAPADTGWFKARVKIMRWTALGG